MYTHYSWAQNLIKYNILAPLDDYISATPDFHKDDFTPTALSFFAKDGKQYGVPTDSAPKMLFRRPRGGIIAAHFGKMCSRTRPSSVS